MPEDRAVVRPVEVRFPDDISDLVPRSIIEQEAPEDCSFRCAANTVASRCASRTIELKPVPMSIPSSTGCLGRRASRLSSVRFNLTKKKGRRQPFVVQKNSCLRLTLAKHRNVDGDDDVGMQRDLERMIADGLERSLRHADCGLRNVEALRLQRFGDVRDW